eukprot:RCo020318
MQPILDPSLRSPRLAAATRLPNISSIPTQERPPRLLSIRLCIIVCFALVVVVTAASVAAVLITSTYKVVDELQAASAQTILQVQYGSDLLVTRVALAAMQMVQNLTNSSLAEESEVSDFTAQQISEMASALMSRDLDVMEQQLEAQLGTVVTTSQATLKYLSDWGLNISAFPDMLDIGREVFSSLSLELTYGATLVDALSGSALRLLQGAQMGGLSFAQIYNGSTSTMSIYQVDPQTSKVVYPESRCYLGRVMCNFSWPDFRQGPEFQLAATLRAGEMAWGPLLVSFPGQLYISLVTPIREKEAPYRMMGVVERNLFLVALQSLLGSVVSSTAGQMMYVVDLSGTVVGSSHGGTTRKSMMNVLNFSEPAVSQSAKWLLQRYGSWSAVASNASGNSLVSITTTTSGNVSAST